MPKPYDKKAIELCRKFYCERGGKNHDLIEQDMRKAGYAGWQKANLHDRGRNHERMGWITRYGFERSLEIYNQGLIAAVNSDEQDLYQGIKRVRQTLQKEVDNGEATKDEIYQYRDFCKLEIDARKNLDLSRDNLETFVAGYEKLVMWLGEIDAKAAAIVVKHGDRLAELAAAHYGKEGDIDSRAIDRTDESGEQPFSLLDRK